MSPAARSSREASPWPRVTDPQDPRVVDLSGLTDVKARSDREVELGLFVAEGHKVITRALALGYRPRRVLAEPRWLVDLGPVAAAAGAEVLQADPELLWAVTGYRVHRGALATFERPAQPPVSELVAGARLLVVLVDLVDHTNVGGVFRNAAALGADAVLVSPGCADPLYRRSVKVSMGAVLALPWARTGPDPLAGLEGAETLALTPATDAEDIGRLGAGDRPRALVLGTEGDGLPPALLSRADRRVRIPMAEGIDSLNVAAASAIALHVLRPGPGGA
jgi:tRNA G18 (ribose-2'-O)-methylase SpoU